MPRHIPSQCTHIADEIEFLEEELGELQRELAHAPANLQAYYRREIKKTLLELGLRRQRLRACEEQNDPPALRPDLLAYGIYATPNHATKKLSVAAIVKNIGRGLAVGPFRIDLSVTEISGNFQRSHFQVFEVPPGLVIHPKPVLTTNEVLAKVPMGAAGGESILFEYVTEKMEVGLLYIDETPSFHYVIDFIVDAEHVLSESNEGNNSFQTKRRYTTQSAVQRTKPFVIDLSQASNIGRPDDETE
jgi:hypothetical protein